MMGETEEEVAMRTSFRRLLALGVLAALAVAAVGASALGDTITVPGGRYDTLQEALENANPGDEIVIERTTLRESVSVRNVQEVTVRSESRSRPAKIVGRYSTKPVIELINCRDVVFENISIQSGSVGVRVTTSQRITFEGCVLEQNYGSGIICSITGAGTSGASFTLESCTVRSNLGWGVEGIGDPSAIQSSQVSFAKTTISDNALGGLHIQAAVAAVSSSTFAGNAGYGIFVDGLAVVTFNDEGSPTQVTDNALGGILVQNAALTLRGKALVQGNRGVGIRAENAQLTLDGATVSGHTEPAVLYMTSQGSVLNSFIQDNAGVGLRLDAQSVVTVSHSTIARQGANGMEVMNGSTATVTDESLLTENKAAGLLADAATATVANATASRNAVAGIRLVNRAQVTGQGALVVDNTLDGIQVDASTLTLTGGLVSRNGQYGFSSRAAEWGRRARRPSSRRTARTASALINPVRSFRAPRLAPIAATGSVS
jgi:hypothetical protein